MTTTAEVIIVGGGIVGASVAWHLRQAGCTDVIILERAARQGTGSTGKATGGVRLQFSTEINIRLSQYSIRFFREFAQRVGGECGYHPYGYLFITRTEEEMRTLRNNVELQLRLGAPVELLDRDAIARLVPPLRVDDLTGGSFCPIDGFLDPVATMECFTNAATRRGVRLQLDTEVLSLDTDARGVAGVRTSRGDFRSRRVVNCAGAWAAAIAPELPLSPLRRQLVAVDADLDLRSDGPMVLEFGGGFHFRRGPWRSDRTPILMGWPDSSEASGFSIDVDRDSIPETVRRASHRLPEMRNAVVNNDYTRAGLYEMSPDHHAIIGESPSVPGLFFANGFSGHGVMHSPATGAILADLILHGRTDLFEVAPLSPDRFRTGELLHETAVL